MREVGLTSSRVEMDPWQSGAWDARIVIKFTAGICQKRKQHSWKRSFTKAHIIKAARNLSIYTLAYLSESDPHIYEATKAVAKPIKNILRLQCSFSSQVVEHRTGIAKVMGSNPVQSLSIFSGLSLQRLCLLHNCEDHLREAPSVASF